MRMSVSLVGSTLFAANLLQGLSAEMKNPRPNIFFILADDLGYSDLGCYGGEARTPNLDSLAERGVRFSQFYNGGKCEPSRVALMTSHRNTSQIGFFGERAKTFLAEALSDCGYQTLISGKWHVSRNPLDRGFQRFYGIEEGGCDYYTGSGRIRSGRDLVEIPEGFYTTDAFTDKAIEFLTDAKKDSPDKPFFMYLAYNAPHDSLQVPENEIAKYRGSYLDGWETIKELRFNRVKELGLIPSDAGITPWPQNLPRWDSLSESQKKMEDLRMATYTAMIDRMDQNIGRVFQWLKDNDEWENTLILFASDNGSNPFDRTPDNMVTSGILPGVPESKWSLGTGWAHVSNTPFRLYKRNQHEGGICAPLIMYWPQLGYETGSISSYPVHIMDFLPTFYSLAGGGEKLEDIEGTDISKPLLSGKQIRPEYRMMGYMADLRYIREGNWKLVSCDFQPWELFDISTDRIEIKNLATLHPEIVDGMVSRWDEWYFSFNKEAFSEKSPKMHMGDFGSGALYVPKEYPVVD